MPDNRRRWVELCTNPIERPDVELKGWLDLNSKEDKANLAHAILAMANHGGGVVLLGYTEEGGAWKEVTEAPEAPSTFTTDSVNAVVQKFADPAFHCELHIVNDDALAHSHPVVVVPGGHTVPVRAKRDGPGRKHVQQNTYYIRRPGPQSAPPQSAAEWREFIHRCVMADRDALLDNLRAALAGESTRGAPDTLAERAATWEAQCVSRFLVVLKSKNAEDAYQLGHWHFAYVFDQESDADARKLLQELRSVERQTGWPAWVMFSRAPIGPYPFDGLIECHVYERDQPREPAVSDFWRAAPDGRFFLLRGYLEDDQQKLEDGQPPGKFLDRHHVLLHLGECLLHAARMAERLSVAGTAVEVRVAWTGLQGRSLHNVFDKWNWSDDMTSPAAQDAVAAHLTVDANRIRLQLNDLVAQLATPLFQVFDFEVVRPAQVEDCLQKMLKRTGGA